MSQLIEWVWRAAPGEEFGLDAFWEMFVDWGWSVELGHKPAWMR